MTRHTQATIHLEAIVKNYQLANQWAPKSKNIAVIKADAYGHGSVKVAEALAPYVPAFAVAIFEEAVELKDAGIQNPILVFQGVNEPSELEYAAKHDLWPMLENEQQVRLITETLLDIPIKVWLKVDSGMHRLGFNQADLTKVMEDLEYCPWVMEEIVLSSHLANASRPQDRDNLQQLKRFLQWTDNLNFPTSMANSAALLGFEQAQMHWNRPGIMMYGLSPFEDIHSHQSTLTPAMTFSSSVISIRQINQGDYVGYANHWQADKPTTIATIGVGYADGYPRHAENGTPLLIAGQKASLVGSVSMDMITADISHCSNIKIGDPVELWGNTINANDIAHHAQTIGYQLLTGVSQRVPRCYA